MDLFFFWIGLGSLPGLFISIISIFPFGKSIILSGIPVIDEDENLRQSPLFTFILSTKLDSITFSYIDISSFIVIVWRFSYNLYIKTNFKFITI